MATLAQLDAQAAALIEALGCTPTRLGSDHRLDLEKIPAGAARYQLRVFPPAIDERRGGNVVYAVAELAVAIHYRLGLAEAERTYTLGDHQTDSLAMLERDYWTALAAVFDVTQGPSMEEAIARVGNVLSYTVAVEVRIQP
jgi:hypothetical protein